jgi:citrate synthase
MRYWGTEIDGVSLEPEQLNVRGKSLNDIVGQYSYSGAVYRLFTGRDADPDEERAFDAYLTRSLLSLEPDNAVIRVAQLAAASGASVSRSMIAGLMAENSKTCSELSKSKEGENSGLERDCLEGSYYFGALPLLLAYVVNAASQEGTEAMATCVQELRDKPADYLSNIFRIVARREFKGEGERKVFEAIMVSFHAGFGFLTPTVMLPRGAIGTGVPIVQALAAGFTAAGSAHVGACEHSMKMFQLIAADPASELDAPVDIALDDFAQRGTPVPGFGHPLFKRDPRNAHLRRLLDDAAFRSPFIRIYDLVSERLLARLGIHPNIDSISAAVFLSLGVLPAFGTGLFLCARAAAMVAHILEKKNKPAFGARSADVRQWLQSLSKNEGEFAMVQ